jgi:hypothetical protein
MTCNWELLFSCQELRQDGICNGSKVEANVFLLEGALRRDM